MGLAGGSSGWRVKRPGLSPEEPIVCLWLVLQLICPLSLHEQVDLSDGVQGRWMVSQTSPGLAGVSGCIGESRGALIPATHPALPPPRYQHLSSAYSPITTETQRERQKGLARQVFEQDASGDERSGPEDSVRDPWVGVTAGVYVWAPAPALRHMYWEMTQITLNLKKTCIDPMSEKLRIIIINIY